MSKTIYKDPARFYVYAFLREDGTPYYIGKGTGARANISAAQTGKRRSPESIAKGLATRKRNKEAKEALALHFSKILNCVQ